MSKTSSFNSSSIRFFGLLAIGTLGNTISAVFITLKLCKVISWSWWWVLAPIWIPFTIVGLLLFIIVLAFVLLYKDIGK